MKCSVWLCLCPCILWILLRSRARPSKDVSFVSCAKLDATAPSTHVHKHGCTISVRNTALADWNTCGVAMCGVFAALSCRRSLSNHGSHRLRCGGRPTSNTVRLATGSDVGVVLLSAGVGKRMGASIPKQYIKLMGLEIALHSLDTFLACDVAEIVIVCAEDWKFVFEDHLKKKGPVEVDVKFTTGGDERQDSVNNGLAKIQAPIVAIHDAARPLVTKDEVEKVVADAREHGAALLAVRTKATIKQAVSESKAFVEGTPQRKLLWEAHTPQVIQSELLRKGFEKAEKEGLEVTDDVSLVEQLGEKVKLTEGEYTNIKVTTPEDIAVAETILKERGFVPPTE
ncbi:ISPD [Symbiodinium natans]|uniref:2-C-methyl-D-erythritol 4-phosphate cytidylyltransferase, chloroplastic n=1 Tax=Symbiodinium natans TaxID=878477 RepID=A0A812IK09_9DINO|nr:ISPD [Symbiodinium natans]